MFQVARFRFFDPSLSDEEIKQSNKYPEYEVVYLSSGKLVRYEDLVLMVLKED